MVDYIKERARQLVELRAAVTEAEAALAVGEKRLISSLLKASDITLGVSIFTHRSRRYVVTEASLGYGNPETMTIDDCHFHGRVIRHDGTLGVDVRNLYEGKPTGENHEITN